MPDMSTHILILPLALHLPPPIPVPQTNISATLLADVKTILPAQLVKGFGPAQTA